MDEGVLMPLYVSEKKWYPTRSAPFVVNNLLDALLNCQNNLLSRYNHPAGRGYGIETEHTAVTMHIVNYVVP